MPSTLAIQIRRPVVRVPNARPGLPDPDSRSTSLVPGVHRAPEFAHGPRYTPTEP
jgi:hypothetical protein